MTIQEAKEWLCKIEEQETDEQAHLIQYDFLLNFCSAIATDNCDDVEIIAKLFTEDIKCQ